MIAIKDVLFSQRTNRRSKGWLKYKKRLKKMFHTKLRRGKTDKLYSQGVEVDY